MEINEFLKANSECMIFCATEHWKTRDQLSNYGLEGFYLASCMCRGKNEHGGSAIFLKRGIQSKERKLIMNSMDPGQFECCIVECMVGKQKFIVLSVYRPRRNVTEFKGFLCKMDEILALLIHENATIIIAGDFNVDILANENESYDLLSLFSSYNVFPTIYEYTRITAVSRSCIDNIFTNSSDIVESKVIHSLLSDHTAQLLSVRIRHSSIDEIQYRRIFNEVSIAQFIDRLKDATWNQVYECDCDDVNSQWDNFMSVFMMYFELAFPRRKFRCSRKQRNKTLHKDPEVNSCRKEMEVLYVAKSCDARYTQLYNSIRRKYNHLLGRARSDQYKFRLQKSVNKTKCMWNIVNEIKGKTTLNRNIQIDGDPKCIADDLNRYFINIGPQLINQLKGPQNLRNIPCNSKSLFLKPVTEQEILEHVRSLKSKLSCGSDEVPTYLIKSCISLIITPLCFILKNSFKFGIFPDSLKLAIIKPIHKKGKTSEFDNYRPISVLSSFSKIFEIIMCNRLTDFLLDNNMFSPTQHGFLKGRSTQTAIFNFTQKIYEAFEGEGMALGLFLDLSKAYDTIDHQLLLFKLDRCGIRGPSLQWFRSYLSSRQQRVEVTKNGSRYESSIQPVKMGIPQGSIVGPVLFVVFLNDLSTIITNDDCFMTNYADDTSLLVRAALYPDIIAVASRLLESASNWFSDNRMILNGTKTDTILFKNSRAGLETPKTITIGDNILRLSESTRFLGLYIDDTLNWRSHVSEIRKKLESACYGISVLSRYLDLNVLKSVYFANFESRIRYGIIFYGVSPEAYGISIIQKRVLRAMLHLSFRETCRGRFRANNLLTFTAIYIQECLLFCFKNQSLFARGGSLHCYATRSEDYLYPRHRLAVTEKSACYNCIKFFNSLPREYKLIHDYKVFKKAIHRLLIDREPYSVSEYFQ